MECKNFDRETIRIWVTEHFLTKGQVRALEEAFALFLDRLLDFQKIEEANFSMRCMNLEWSFESEYPFPPDLHAALEEFKEALMELPLKKIEYHHHVNEEGVRVFESLFATSVI